MKVKPVLRQLNQILESENEIKGRERHDALKKILKKLTSKQSRLEQKLEAARDDDKRKIGKKLKTVRTHREKALKVLKKMEDN